MYAARHQVSVTTDGTGVATGYGPVVTGRVASIIYTPDGTAPYDATVDFTITSEATGQNIWVESNIAAGKVMNPVQPAHAAATGAASTLSEAPVILAEDRVKIVLAQGGAAKTGKFTIIMA